MAAYKYRHMVAFINVAGNHIRVADACERCALAPLFPKVCARKVLDYLSVEGLDRMPEETRVNSPPQWALYEFLGDTTLTCAQGLDLDLPPIRIGFGYRNLI